MGWTDRNPSFAHQPLVQWQFSLYIVMHAVGGSPSLSGKSELLEKDGDESEDHRRNTDDGANRDCGPARILNRCVQQHQQQFDFEVYDALY